MKVNFQISDNHRLSFAPQHIDLQNNFDFVGFAYNREKSVIKLHWKKSNGSLFSNNEIYSLVLIHSLVTFLKVENNEYKNRNANERCLKELTFFPSSIRNVNDIIKLQFKPNEGDDIIYFFENGKSIKIHCEIIELSFINYMDS